MKKILPYLLAILITVPAILPLLQPNWYYNMHDDMQLIRQLELEKCLHDGQIPCRWVPDLGYGYGYPLFNFYPPFPYFVGQIFRTFRFNFLDTVKGTAILQFVFCSLAMYLLTYSLTKRKSLSLLAATFFTYAPYHAVNIYIRGAMNEAWAAVFFPLLLHYSRLIILENKKINLLKFSLAFTGITLSHNPMNLAFAPIVAIWCLYWIYQNKHKNVLGSLGKLTLSGICGVGLSAFYLIPVLFETKYVQIESMFANYYSYFTHFTTLKQLFFDPFWSDGPSQWGPLDGMPFTLGILHWLIPVTGSIFLILKLIKNKKLNSLDALALLITFLGLFAAFMTHERSNFMWLIFKTFQKMQFPWRFLNPASFLLSLASGLVVFRIVPAKIINQFSLVTIILLIAVYLPYFTPVTSGPISENQKFSGQAWINQVTSGIYDYLPKTAQKAPQQAAKQLIDSSSTPNSYTVNTYRQGSNWQTGSVTITSPTTLVFSQLAFPGLKIVANSEVQKYSIEPEFGRPTLSLKPGVYNIQLQVEQTITQLLANTTTLLTMVSILSLYVYFRRKQQPLRAKR